MQHESGIARIPYDKLPQALKARYFDPAKVAAYRKSIADARLAAEAKAAELQRQQREAEIKAENYEKLLAQQQETIVQEKRHQAERQRLPRSSKRRKIPGR